MNSRNARRLLLAALVLGAAGNYLLRAEWWRAGFFVWVLGVAVTALLMGHTQDSKGDASITRERGILFGVAVSLAALFVLRDAEMLFALDLFALLVVTALVAWRAQGRSLAALEPRDAVVGGIAAASTVIAGAPTLAFRDAAPGTIEPDQRRAMGSFGIGAIAATPVLLVVALLLGNADPLFAGFLEETATLFDAALVTHLIGTLVAAWVAAGAVRGSLVPIGPAARVAGLRVRLPFPSLAPLLYGLTLLLSAWIGLQVRTLFGGAEYVAATSGITVAEYARNGFFELIVIAGIVLGSLLVADEVLDRDAEKARTSLRTIGFVLLGLVAAVLTSALLRMSLYLRFYGLTEDRVMALAILTWVALMLAWFGFTVLRGQRARFAPGVLIISALWLGGLNLVNPERLIVETNLRRAERGLDFDAKYHARLSGDALPALVDGIARLDPVQGAILRNEIAKSWAKRAEEHKDWRSYSLPYLNAQSILETLPQ